MQGTQRGFVERLVRRVSRRESMPEIHVTNPQRIHRKAGRMHIEEIADRTDTLTARLLDVWEASVRATHHFLTDAQILAIKGYVPQALESVERLVVCYGDDLADRNDPDGPAGDTAAPLAFMGVQGGRLEMLFVTPRSRGKGIGTALLDYGIGRLGVTELTVNEQNPQAIGFYEHMGFRTYKRTDHDEEDNPLSAALHALAERESERVKVKAPIQER